MLRLPRFTFHAPEALSEALKLLSDHGPEAMLVAGGTDVYPKMKRRQFQPKALVSLRGLRELAAVRGEAGAGMTLGAGATLTEIANHAEIKTHYAGLSTAAGAVSTPVLRNMGTLGGNLCLDTRCNYYDQTREWRKSIDWCKKAPGPDLTSEQVPCRVAPGSPKCLAASSTDTAPVLIALGAEVTLVGPEGERRVPVEALFHYDGMHYLTKRRDEILTEVHLPAADGIKTAYLKLRRRGAFDFPVLGAEVALKLDDGGTVRKARVALGGVASRPLLVEEAGQALVGYKLDDDTLQAAAQAAFGPARPMDNTDFHLGYRKKMVPVYVQRALRAAAGISN